MTHSNRNFEQTEGARKMQCTLICICYLKNDRTLSPTFGLGQWVEGIIKIRMIKLKNKLVENESQFLLKHVMLHHFFYNSSNLNKYVDRSSLANIAHFHKGCIRSIATGFYLNIAVTWLVRMQRARINEQLMD